MTATRTTSSTLDDPIPAMTYRELFESLEMVAQGGNRAMVPYLVSALREQAPFLTARMVLFEILRSANCLADQPLKASPLN